MTQFTNLDIEKNLQFTSNKILVIHKGSREYTDKHNITKHLLTVRHIHAQFHLLKITLNIGHVAQ